jgi:peptidoglycan hydrolase-like protein with peptidoglycan-binding domain
MINSNMRQGSLGAGAVDSPALIAGCIGILRNPDDVDVGRLEQVSFNSERSEVLLLERALRELGFFDQRPDIYFDSNTSGAVKRFQLSVGLTDDGVVGSQTWRALELRVNLTGLANDPYIHCLPR